MSDYQIRWLTRKDLPFVLEIERAQFGEWAWSEEGFLACLRQRNCIGMVAEYRHQVVGYMLYELNKNVLSVINFAVHPDLQRHGVGTAMADKLKVKLSLNHRKMLVVDTRESNLSSHLFWHAQGFVATEILRGYYEGTDEDAYRFIFRAEWAEEERPLPAEAACEV